MWRPFLPFEVLVTGKIALMIRKGLFNVRKYGDSQLVTSEKDFCSHVIPVFFISVESGKLKHFNPSFTSGLSCTHTESNDIHHGFCRSVEVDTPKLYCSVMFSVHTI